MFQANPCATYRNVKNPRLSTVMLWGAKSGTRASTTPRAGAAADAGLRRTAVTSRPAPEHGRDAARHDDEGNDEERVRHDVLQTGTHGQHRERLGKREDRRPDRHPGEVLEPAEHDNGKALQLKRGAEIRGEAELQGHQTSREARERRADAERQRADPLRVDPGEQRGLRVLHRRAKRLAHVRVVQHDVEDRHHGERNREDDEARDGDPVVEKRQRLVRVAGDNRLIFAAPDCERHVLQHEPQPEQHQERRDRQRLPHAPDQTHVNNPPDDEEDRHVEERTGDRIEMPRLRVDQRHERPEHEEAGVAQVDDLHDAVNDGEAVRHHRVQPRRQYRRDADRDQVLSGEHLRLDRPTPRATHPPYGLGIGSVTARVSGRWAGHTIRTVLPGVVCTMTYGALIWPSDPNLISPPGSIERSVRCASASRTLGPSSAPALLMPASNARAVSKESAWNQSGTALYSLVYRSANSCDAGSLSAGVHHRPAMR